jgi:hypothetical protein
MSKPVKRRCLQCGKVKLFRAYQKTCGCLKPGVAPKVDPLLGKYFWLAQDAKGAFLAGRIISRISSSLYLVRYYDLHPSGREGWHEKLVSVSVMRDWEVSDSDYHDIWLTLRSLEAEEQQPPVTDIKSDSFSIGIPKKTQDLAGISKIF